MCVCVIPYMFWALHKYFPKEITETLVLEGAVDFQPWSENHFRCLNNQEIFHFNSFAKDFFLSEVLILLLF